MLKAYIVDDDPPSAKIIEYFLKEYGTVEIAGTFTDPLSAIARFEKDKPQLVFLDINMPQMNGVEAAEKLMELNPETDIIFTTAYDHFAVDAFELNASDYIVKPVMKARFDKSMERIIKKHGQTAESTEKLSIRCFGKFGIFCKDSEPVKWRTEKSKELAALLIFQCGREVSRDEIIELLWPDTDLDRAVHYLHNSIYYIRKSLEECGIGRSALQISGTYSITIGKEVDYDLGRYRVLDGLQHKETDVSEELISICRKGFMDGEDWNWAVLERESIEEKCLNTLIKLSSAFIKNKEYARAEELLKEAYGKNPYDERITTLLVKLYINTNQKIKAMVHFNDYSELIKSELGIHPGKFIKELISSIK
jgi:two-component SAPR family response regulator